MQKNICLLNDSFPPQIDGVANAVRNYAEYIEKNHGKAMVVTPSFPDVVDDYPYPVLRYPSIDMRKLTGYMAGVPFSPEVANRLQRERVDLLHSHCPVASTLMARELREIVDAPLVMTYHTKFDVDIANIVRNRLLQEGSVKALVQNIKACDEVWVVSSGAGENLRSLGYDGEYVVMRNGVDMPLGKAAEDMVRAVTAGYDLPDEVPVYLFVGRLMWYKGLKIIVDALAKMKGEGYDFRMVFIGAGGDMEAVQAYCIEQGLADRCIFTGAITDREYIRAWYSRADLFLFPSTFDTNGLVVREAAASYLPTVMIDGSCAAEGVTHGQNGFLIEENADSMAACLKKLYGKEGLIKAVGENAARELYVTWETAVEEAFQRYQIVIDRYRSGQYPKRHKPMDAFLRAHGELMEDLGKIGAQKDELEEKFRNKQQELEVHRDELEEKFRTKQQELERQKERIKAELKEKKEELWQKLDRYL